MSLPMQIISPSINNKDFQQSNDVCLLETNDWRSEQRSQ